MSTGHCDSAAKHRLLAGYWSGDVSCREVGVFAICTCRCEKHCRMIRVETGLQDLMSLKTT